MTLDPFGGIIRTLVVLGVSGYALTLGLAHPRLGQVRLWIVGLVALAFAVLPTLADMGVRNDLGLTGPDGQYLSSAHDGGVLQTEVALDFLLDGESPYSADYRDTEMANGVDSNPALWRELGLEENPAFDFFPYPPGVLMVSLPAKGFSSAAFGGYDQRLTYLFAYAFLICVLAFGCSRESLKAPVVALIALNPMVLFFIPQGRNDVLFVAGLVVTAVALSRHRWRWSGISLALTCALKQFAWPLVPFFLAYAWGRRKSDPSSKASAAVISFVAASLLIWLPFLIWDAGGLFHSLIEGQGSVFPFRTGGFGVTDALVFLNIIDSQTSGFPVSLLGALAALPLVIWGSLKLLKQPSLVTAFRYYSVALFIVLFFSRYFAANHFGALTSVWFITALLAGGWIGPRRKTE